MINSEIVGGLDMADLFLRNRVNAKPESLNEYDIEILLDIANICDKASSFIARQQAEIDKNESYCESLTAIIKTQRSDIERLQKENDNFADIGKMYSEIKSEARKEFARKLKTGVPQETGVIRCADIDNILKEMDDKK